MTPVAHFEIHCDDLARAAKFYTDTFGWDIKKWEGPFEYWMVMTCPKGTPGGINGGLVKRFGAIGQGMNGYCCTITVDDFDAVATKVIAHGGKEAMPKMAIPGIAWQGYFQDTEGNTFGLHQIDPNAK